MSERLLTEQGEAAIAEFCFGPHGDEPHSAYAGRVGDRVADISSKLDTAFLSNDGRAIQEGLAELRRLRLALDCCSILDLRFAHGEKL